MEVDDDDGQTENEGDDDNNPEIIPTPLKLVMVSITIALETNWTPQTLAHFTSTTTETAWLDGDSISACEAPQAMWKTIPTVMTSAASSTPLPWKPAMALTTIVPGMSDALIISTFIKI